MILSLGLALAGDDMAQSFLSRIREPIHILSNTIALLQMLNNNTHGCLKPYPESEPQFSQLEPFSKPNQPLFSVRYETISAATRFSARSDIEHPWNC
jgi:hypothetical protein